MKKFILYLFIFETLDRFIEKTLSK